MTWLGLALALLAEPAAADVSLVHVVQGQSESGGGLLSKSLIDVSRSKMRLVTALAPRLEMGEGAQAGPEPWRTVQVLDLATTSLWLLDPESRTYEKRPLGALVEGPAPAAGARPFMVASSSVSLSAGRLRRKCLGSDCAHWNAVAVLKLRRKGSKRATVEARLELDLWLASLSGEPQRALLDLIAFEAAYRKQAKTELSPLDRLAYRVGEASERLGVAPRELERVVGRVRRELKDLPGYPLTASVVWWTESPRPAAPTSTKREPKLLQDPPPQPLKPKPRLVKIDWHAKWDRVDRALERAQAGIGRAPVRGPAQPEVLVAYERFQGELRAVLDMLGERAPPRAQQEAAPEDAPARNGGQGEDTIALPRVQAPGPASAKEARAYEAFSDVTEIVFIGGNLPEDRFQVPPGFKRR